MSPKVAHGGEAITRAESCQARRGNPPRTTSLLAERLPEIVELVGGAEEHVAARDELRVFLDEDLARRAEVEFARLVAEEFAVHARPDEAAVGVDVHLRHAELRGGEIFVRVDAPRVLGFAAGGVYAIDFLLLDGRGAVHDERKAGEAGLDFFEHVEVERLPALEFERAVAGADRAGE